MSPIANTYIISTVLAHITCYAKQDDSIVLVTQWEDAVRDSGATDIKIVLHMLNPDMNPGLELAQGRINHAAKDACYRLNTGYITRYRNPIYEPSPGDERLILPDGAIVVGGDIVTD